LQSLHAMGDHINVITLTGAASMVSGVGNRAILAENILRLVAPEFFSVLGISVECDGHVGAGGYDA
jgi:hypothetical protein